MSFPFLRRAAIISSSTLRTHHPNYFCLHHIAASHHAYSSLTSKRNNGSQNNSSSGASSTSRHGKKVTILLSFVIVASSLYLFTETYVPLRLVYGPSMYPTMQNDSKVRTWMYSPRKIVMALWDIALKRENLTMDQLMRKAKNNVQVDFENGPIFIYSKPGHEIHVAKRLKQILYLRDTNQFYVWMEGDNPPQSLDSRSYGYVRVGLIQGMVLIPSSIDGLYDKGTKVSVDAPLRSTTRPLTSEDMKVVYHPDPVKKFSDVDIDEARREVRSKRITARREVALGGETISVPVRRRNESGDGRDGDEMLRDKRRRVESGASVGELFEEEFRRIENPSVGKD